MIRGVPMRIGLAVVAVGIVGWLGFQLVDAWRLRSGQAVAFRVGSKPSRSDIRHADRVLRSGGFAFDRQRRYARAFLLGVHAKQARRAIPLLISLTRSEPDNADAWSLLGIVASASHPRLAARARARALELVPPVRP
jgi:hypothetical protein